MFPGGGRGGKKKNDHVLRRAPKLQQYLRYNNTNDRGRTITGPGNDPQLSKTQPTGKRGRVAQSETYVIEVPSLEETKKKSRKVTNATSEASILLTPSISVLVEAKEFHR